ncbi:MAG TPA: multiheme c-type cytochrome [Kofleriaceae bacterium]|jgi:predicted CXXCH cytochrome family protein|nr:multiheme c-type cytochrome [Kofleriaceae bacterium]
MVPRRRAWWKAIGLCALAGAGVALLAGRTRSPDPRPIGAARPTRASDPLTGSGFVGAAVCASCHPREAAAWTGSHHQRAMQPASASTVLGDFAGARFSHAGVASTWFRRAGAYAVRTDGPDGALHDYPVAYTLGVAPLQQYLVAFPGGRLQSPEIAWDSRPAATGGQRWFHLYPGESIGPTDPLHWTGAAENWNYMCADCHSTNVRKAWSAQTATYATTFAEVSVACEACHGPGARHVAWASTPPDRRPAAGAGLPIALDERAGVFWARDPSTHRPARSRPRSSAREIEMCARCHARRGLVHEGTVHGQPVGDDYRVALLDEDLYYPDGQIKGEVYEYGSFVQSRMFAAGVTCSDCHDPHGGGLRAPGDALCLQCHDPAYATPNHHFHPAGSPGAQCVGCHMPATTYMVVDRRRDHSLRVPRPDLSLTLGVPNPCHGCHADRPAAWAARTARAWYGHAPSGLQQFAEALAAGTLGAPDAPRRLAALVADRGQPAIARATAIARLERWPTPATLDAIRGGVDDSSPLVRRAAAHALAGAAPAARAALAAPLLDDPVRTVRLEAAATLTGVPPDAVAASPGALDRATAELVAALELDGDRPAAHVALAALHARQGAADRAEAELLRALAIDPAWVPASVNLADLCRAQGRDGDAERVLRAALARTSRAAALWHALGLTQVRTHRLRDALDALGTAARLGPDDPRHGYVYAVALHDAGDRPAALRALAEVVRRHPHDRDTLAALVAFHREAGDLRSARRFAEQLAALDPEAP